MTQEQGIILRVTGNGWVDVLTQRTDACEGCGASHCCADSGIEKKMIVKAINRAGAEPFDRVALELQSGTLMKGAIILYLIPLIGFLMGAVIGALLHESMPFSETGSEILFAFAGLGFGFIFSSGLSKIMSRKGGLTPVISRVIEKGREKITQFIDPVCNMVVDPSEAEGSVEYNGVVYYFCSQGCRLAFQQEAEKFISK